VGVATTAPSAQFALPPCELRHCIRTTQKEKLKIRLGQSGKLVQRTTTPGEHEPSAPPLVSARGVPAALGRVVMSGADLFPCLARGLQYPSWRSALLHLHSAQMEPSMNVYESHDGSLGNFALVTVAAGQATGDVRFPAGSTILTHRRYTSTFIESLSMAVRTHTCLLPVMIGLRVPRVGRALADRWRCNQFPARITLQSKK
jgi:hypothetical protein